MHIFFSQKYTPILETSSHVKNSGGKLRFFRDFVSFGSRLFFGTQILILAATLARKESVFIDHCPRFSIARQPNGVIVPDIGCQHGGLTLLHIGKQRPYNKVAQNNVTPVCLCPLPFHIAILLIVAIFPVFHLISPLERAKTASGNNIVELWHLHVVSFS